MILLQYYYLFGFYSICKPFLYLAYNAIQISFKFYAIFLIISFYSFNWYYKLLFFIFIFSCFVCIENTYDTQYINNII